MPRKNLLLCPRSMKKVSSSETNSYGVSRPRRCSVLLLGLLLCIFVPNYAAAAFFAPNNCTSVIWMYSGSKVQNISCAGQQLISVPKDGKEGSDVFKFDLSNNNISSLAIDEFQYFSNLQYIDLSENLIQSFPSDTFFNLTSLQSLNLAVNNLTNLPSGTFAAASLVTLNASRNAKFVLEKKRSDKFRVLDLSYTNLASVDKEHFKYLAELQEVDLSHNELTTLDKHLFKGLDNLLKINLSWNELTKLENAQAFKQCSGLNTLDLSNNKIVDVDNEFLRGADSVSNLDLSYNQITSLDRNVFDDVVDLETLYLDHNNLTSLNKDLFDYLTELTTLYLNNNKLLSIPAELFKDNGNLQYLYLSANQLSTIPTDLWQYQTTLKVDVSGNSFICDCDQRDYLYDAWYDSDKEIVNLESTSCTDSSLNQHVYLDYNDASCSGNLGGACTSTRNCMVRNSRCDGSNCVCSDDFYDTNDGTTDGGLCEEKVALDYPCPSMDAACTGDNVECTTKSPSSSETYCLCITDYYDDNPQYLDGTCRLKAELGESCISINNMCRPDNSICGTSSTCECQSTHYDNNGVTTAEGECLEKLPLNSACNKSYQCAPSNSECSSNRCLCSSGYYDFTNSGQCRDPSSFYSCSPTNKSSLQVTFAIVHTVTNEIECKRHCFEQDERYYHMEGSTQCLCGHVSSDRSCCPMVLTTCTGKVYLGPSTLLAKAGINVTHVARPTAGFSQSFSVTTDLNAIDQLKFGYGDSMTETTVTASSATVTHTYTHAGLFWLNVSAWASAFGVSESVAVPIKVQVQPENVTTYLTGVSNEDVSSDLTAKFSATFKMGIDIDVIFSKTYNGAVTKKMGCVSGFSQHRHSCIKLESTSATFSTANASCSANSAALLKIDFMAELSEIITILNASTETFYLGAQRVGGVWQMIDGSKAPWSDSDLTVSTNGDCVMLDGSSSKLTSASCTSSAKYVCMKEPVSCPKGGELMSSGYCYVLASVSASTKSWTDANDYCGSNFGGWLANITDTATQTTVTSLLTTGGVSDAWFGLRYMSGVYLWGDNSVFDLYGTTNTPTITSNDGDCFSSTDTGSWYSQDCSNIKNFVCQYSENIQRVTVPNYVLGNADIGIPAGQDIIRKIPASGLTSTATDVLLFPGYSFSRSGNIQAWTFCSIALVSGSHDIAFDVWRPSCSSGTLFQAGCIPTMFASCSTGTPSCAPSTTCSDSEKFCYLSSSCKFMNESCTCNSETSSGTGCGIYGTKPTYTLVSRTMVTITETGQKCYEVSEGDKAIQEGDIIGLQFPAGTNIVASEDCPSCMEQQEVYSTSASDWYVMRDTFPLTISRVNRTYKFQVSYTQDTVLDLPVNLGYASSVGSYQIAASLVEGESKQLSVSLLESIDGLEWVYPTLGIASSSSSSFGTAYTELNQNYYFTLTAPRGTDLEALFSFNTSQKISFTNACVSAVAAAVGNDCNSTLYWSNKPFASFYHTTSTVGTHNVLITVSNSLGSVAKTLTYRTDERISGVALSLVTPSLIQNNVAVNSPAQFSLAHTSGTGVTYAFTVGGSAASPTNSSLYFTFLTVGTFVVQGTVENILSTDTESITVFAKIVANFSNCQFLDTPYIAAVGLSTSLKLQCDCNTGSEVSAVWMLGDRTANITSAISTVNTSPVSWMQPVTFSSVSVVTVIGVVQDPFEAVSITGIVTVYNQVPSVSLVSNGSDVFRNAAVKFTASVPSSPGSYGTVQYNFSYGDGATESSSSGIVTHVYSTGNNYTVSVTASNGPSSATSSVYVAVYEEVTGTGITYNGPKEKSQPVTFTVSVTEGNFLSYRFKSSPSAFDVTQPTPTYSHTFTSADDYNVTVIVSNTLSQQSKSLIAYVMDPGDIIISGFKIDGNDVSNCLETKIGRNLTVAVIHYSVATVVCDWDLGDGTVYSGTSCSKTYAYPSAGNFTVVVTAKYNPQNAQENITRVVCFQERISSPTISIASPVALPSTGQITKNVTLAVGTGNPLTYNWSTNATGGSTTGTVFPVGFSSEGTFLISVTVSNEINSLTVDKIVTVVEEISGMAISCSSCIKSSGQFYVRNGTAYSFSVTTVSGTGITFTWDFGDSTTGSGYTNSHTYTAIGTHNITVSASSTVTSTQTIYVTVHVEAVIQAVTLSNYLWDWKDDHQNATVKDLDISKIGKFKATPSPSGMDNLEYIWIFETGLTEEITTTDIGEHTYNTTGSKTCTVTVRNSLGNVTSAPFMFYVVTKIVSSSIEVTENGSSLLGTSETSTHKVPLNTVSVITTSSIQIVPNTVQYFLRLKKKSLVTGTWVLQASTIDNTDPTLQFNFTQEAVYSLEVSFTNSLGLALITVYTEAIVAISGPFITAPVGADGNITLNSSITLTGGATLGEYLTYNWLYLAAPSGQSLPSATTSSITITPDEVGQYTVALEVSNPVSNTLSVTYMLNVEVAVTGVGVAVTMQYPNAVKVGTSLNFNGTASAGTGLSYHWDVLLAGSSQATGNAQAFSFLFSTQALYNITLTIENYASSGTATVPVYSLNEVPHLKVQSSDVIYIPSINKYAASTNTLIPFTSNISNTDYIAFDWKVNGTSEVSTETFSKNFTSPVEYVVQLNASNRVNFQNSEIAILAQDPLTGFTIQNCIGTFLMNTIITLTASYTKGTSVSIVWVREQFSNASGTATTVNYPAVGNYSVNVTGSNYVSQDTTSCWITTQGRVNNLNVAVSRYKFVNYSVTFNVTGDYIYPATVTWKFSHGVTRTTSNAASDTATLDIQFAAQGNYTLEVTVANDVSSSTANVTVEVQELACSEPTLQVVGSTDRQVRRASDVDLSVDMSTGGCTDYNSVNSWKIYTASSCAAALTNEYPLPSSTKTNTPNLQLSSNTVAYGTYCVVFTHRYENTPVEQYRYINLTVLESPLTAVQSGGHTRGASEGTTLTVNASESYDPDDITGTTLTYQWTCNQAMGTASASAVCAKINALSVSSANLTGLTLTSGEHYEVQVTVSAPSRTSGSITQIINIQTTTTPVVFITCTTCNAYGHYKLTSSRSYAFEGVCKSGCAGSITYKWEVIDTALNTKLSIDDTQTSTGTEQQNFVLKHSNLDPGKTYTFKLSAAKGSEIGSAEITLSPSTKPSAGNCTFTPSAGVIPLFTKLKYTCTNIVDPDTLTGIYYKVEIKSSTVYFEPIIAYCGPKAENEIYVVPFPGTSGGNVDVKVTAVNDYGAENPGHEKTLSFTSATLLSSQSDNIDYIVDQMTSIIPTMVMQNDPLVLRQFLVSALGYLNDQSLNNVGTSAQRKAIRDVIINSLSGLPMSSVCDIQLTASALAYLVDYPAENSLDTITKALNEINTMRKQWESGGIQSGSESRDYDSATAIDVNAKIQQALKSPSDVVSDSAVLAEFGNMDDLVPEVSSSIQTATNASIEAQTQALIEQSISYSTELIIIKLKATIPNEDPFEKSSTDYEVRAWHVSTDQTIEQYNSNLGTTISLPRDALSLDSSYTEESVFQVLYINKVNQFDFGYSNIDINTVTLSASFHDPSGSTVSVNDLSDGNKLTMHFFAENVTLYAINETGLQNSSGYNPLQNMNYSSKTLTPGSTWAVTLNNSNTGAAMHVQIRPNFTSTGAQLNATLYKNSEAYTASASNKHVRPMTITKEMMDYLKHNHLDFTFFIPAAEIAVDDVIQIRMTLSETASVQVGTYYSKCEFFDESTSKWDNNGCSSLAGSIVTVIECSCNHMTSFGGSLLVSPDQLDFTDLTQIDIASNPVAIITCSVIIGLYIILVIAFRRMDLLDLKRISLIPLCGKDGSFKYEVTIVTGRLPGAGTSAHVGIRLFGEYGRSARQHVIKGGAFQRNCSDTFIIAYDVNLGDLKKLQIWHDNGGLSPSWYLSHVIVNDLQTDNKYYFFGNTWLSLEKENGSIQKELKAAGTQEMSRFGHRLKTSLFNSLADKHLWLSLFNRPAQSRFTRVQRVTCCVTILFTFVVVNAMWYGLLKKDNTDLGFEGFGWEEVVLALVSNIMVLPVSVGLVFLFKKSRSKPNFLDHVQKPQTAQTLEIENLCGNSQGGSFESSNTGAIPYDLERESTIDSVPPATALGLHRSRHVAKTHRENTDDSLLQKRPSVAVTSASSKSPLWNEDGIMKWPDEVPTYDDGADSRPSTGSTMAGSSGVRQPPVKAGGSTPGAARKSRTVQKGVAGELLDELDKLENDLKETESRSGKSTSSKKSISLRKPTMHKSQWGSLEDILQSDDESVAESSGKMKKRGSTTSHSTSRKFNPREDPRINGNGRSWPKSRESAMSGVSSGSQATRGGATAGLRPGYYSEMTMESRDIRIPVHKEGCTLPPWCIYIAYVICFLLSVFSIIIVILYCFKFGSEESLKWVLALILSLILSFLVIEPLKALLIAVYVVAMFKSVEEDEDDDFIDIEPTFDNSNEKIKDVKFKPISGFALLQAQEEGRKIHRMNVMIRQFIAYLFYMWLIMVIVYVHFHFNTYLMTKHVENDFIAPTTNDHKNFTNISTIGEFWDWTETVLVDSLYKQNSTEDEEHGLLLGEARMRLIRGITMNCQARNAASGLGASSLTDRTCYGDGDYDEDTGDYAEGWNHSNSNFSWRHYSAGELGSTHKIGHVATYGGGGYPQGLGTSPAETDSIISHLKDKGWIDLQTRAIIFEFALYSAGSDMTALVALLAEFPLTGGVITSYEIQSQKLLWFQERTVDPLMVLECILFLVVVYSVIHSALQIRERGKQFFKDLWNWYEMLTTLMALVSIGMYIGCVVEATNTFNKFLDNQTGFTNFERVVYVHVGMRYLHAWLLFLLMFKVVKQLRFIKFMYVYEQTLSKAVGHLLGTGLIYVILLLVYAQVGYLMYGQFVSGFESVGHTITTLLVMIRGSFDFWPMLDYHPIFSHFYVYSYYTFAYGIMIALVISILTSTYKVMKSQMYYKATLEMQDYEMIDFMLKRFKLWSGIQKPKPAFRRVRFPGLPSVSSRSSSSYSNRSSSSLHSSQSITGPQFSEVQLRSMMARMAPTWQAVLRRMDKIVALDDEEESLVKKAENEMKNLNWKCRVNEIERQHKDILSWKNQPSTSGKPPIGETKQRQSILKRSGAAKDNQDRKAPATVSGAPSRTAASTPDADNGAQGRRPLSDQGVRVEQASTSKKRSSSIDKSKIQTFFKSIKPSKPAWNK